MCVLGEVGSVPTPTRRLIQLPGPLFLLSEQFFFFFFFKLFYILVSCSRIPFGKGITQKTKTKPQTQMTFLSLVHTLWFSGSAGNLLLFPTYQIALHIITTLWFCLCALGCWLGHFLKLVKGQASRDVGAMDLCHRPAVGRERQSETVLRPTQGGQG